MQRNLIGRPLFHNHLRLYGLTHYLYVMLFSYVNPQAIDEVQSTPVTWAPFDFLGERIDEGGANAEEKTSCRILSLQQGDLKTVELVQSLNEAAVGKLSVW